MNENKRENSLKVKTTIQFKIQAFHSSYTNKEKLEKRN